MKNKKICIYKIYFPTNKCYIGQTISLEKRMFAHLRSKSFVGNALRKYEDWQVSILHVCKTRDEANRIEIEEIRNFNSINPNGYNLTRGGDGGPDQTGKHWKLSKETKNKISIALKGRVFQTMLGKNNPMFGQKRIDVTKRNKENKYAQGMNRPDVSERNKKNNPVSHSVQSEIKRLKTRISKLEAEIV